MPVKTDDKKKNKTQKQREQILDYLTQHEFATASEFAEILRLKDTRTKEILRGMAAENFLGINGIKSDKMGISGF